MKKFNKTALKAGFIYALSDKYIRIYVSSLLSRSYSAVFHLSIVESALSSFSGRTKFLDAEARITSSCAEFFERLKSIGYRSLVKADPKNPVRLLCLQFHLETLEREMRKRLDYDASLEALIKLFLKLSTQEAVNYETYAVCKASQPVVFKRRAPEWNHVTMKNASRPEKTKRRNPAAYTLSIMKKDYAAIRRIDVIVSSKK